MDIIGKQQVGLFKLGDVFVYTYQLPQEIAMKLPPTEVYWQSVQSGNCYGPFPSIVGAMSHYSWFVDLQKKGKPHKEGDVIFMDFIRKQRIVYK